MLGKIKDFLVDNYFGAILLITIFWITVIPSVILAFILLAIMISSIN